MEEAETGSFGNCEKCGIAREAEIVDSELIITCPNGHRSDLLDLSGSFGYTEMSRSH